jgi:hypothetical protein
MAMARTHHLELNHNISKSDNSKTNRRIALCLLSLASTTFLTKVPPSIQIQIQILLFVVAIFGCSLLPSSLGPLLPSTIHHPLTIIIF